MRDPAKGLQLGSRTKNNRIKKKNCTVDADPCQQDGQSGSGKGSAGLGSVKKGQQREYISFDAYPERFS